MTARNVQKVPAKQWRRWSEQARRIFNAVFAEMADQKLFLHPKARAVPRALWRTTRWNAAWVAADAVAVEGR